MSSTGLSRGRVSRLEPTRGFGFISPDDSSRAVFFHVSSLERWADFERLFLGCPVEYTVLPAEKGPRAEGVRLLGETSP